MITERESQSYRIRRLTPKETMRLMGFEDKDYDALVKCGLSDSAIYHISGDSIIVTVLVGIFNNLIENNLNKHNIKITEYIERNLK